MRRRSSHRLAAEEAPMPPEAESENKGFGQQLDSNCVMANSQPVTWKSPCFEMESSSKGLDSGWGLPLVAIGTKYVRK
jgi:hypothetical protein